MILKIASSVSFGSRPRFEGTSRSTFDLAALRKAVHVPANRGDQARDLQQRRMKKMRQDPNLAGGLLHQLRIFPYIGIEIENRS
jgi:hypothetical protein